MDVASGCRIPFQKPAFVFLASVITSLYSSIWAGFQLEPYGGLGRGKGRPSSLYVPVLQGSWSR